MIFTRTDFLRRGLLRMGEGHHLHFYFKRECIQKHLILHLSEMFSIIQGVRIWLVCHQFWYKYNIIFIPISNCTKKLRFYENVDRKILYFGNNIGYEYKILTNSSSNFIL